MSQARDRVRDENSESIIRQASKDLRVARGILFLVGFVTIVANLIFYFSANENVARQVDKELEAIGGRANVAPQKKDELRKLEEEAVRTTKIACVVFTIVGVLYLIFGCCIKEYPVAITIAALILFISGNIVSAVLDPEMVAKGIVIKICVIVALAKSIQAAISFETERKLLKRRRYLDDNDRPASDDFEVHSDLLPDETHCQDEGAQHPRRTFETVDELSTERRPKSAVVWIPVVLLAIILGAIGAWLLFDEFKEKPEPQVVENDPQPALNNPPPALKRPPLIPAPKTNEIRLKQPPAVPIVQPIPSRPLLLPSLPKALVINPPMLEKDTQEYKLSAPFDAMTIGGGGRYLIFRLMGESKLAIFDVSAAKVVKLLPVAEPGALIAAGMNYLMIALPNANVIQRWSLETFEREASAPLPFKDAVLGLCMGSASDGPLLVCEKAPRASYNSNRGHLLDIKTLQTIDFRDSRQSNLAIHAPFMRASPDGRVFGWRTSSGSEGHGMGVLVLRPDGADYKERGMGDYLLAPGTDGRTICCIRGIMDLNMNSVFPRPENNNLYRPFVPAVQGSYFLQLLSTEFETLGRLHDGRGTVVLYHSGSNHEVVRLTSVDGIFGMNLGFGGMPNPIAYDQRVLFVPAAKMLINIPKGNDRLMLRRLDIEEELEKSGKDYLLILSEAPRVALLGAEFQYQIQAKAKRGGIKYRLDSGPSGMTISDGGLVRWRVPNDFSEREVKCIVSVADSAGSERTQSIQIDVSPKAPLTQK